VSGLIRLQKFLAATGVDSRRGAEKLIKDGRVKVNGLVVKKMGLKIDPRQDKVELDDLPLELPVEKKYYLLNKPAGYLTTVKDPFGRATVMELFPRHLRPGLFPVGRLDLDTEGLLLLTNDGQLAYRLTHPRFGVKKKYLALVQGILGREKLLLLRNGVLLKDGWTSPAQVKIVSIHSKKNQSLLEIILHEGKKRQVRRMCAAIGHPVLKLKRTSLAFLTLKGLQPGSYRPLFREEVEKLSRKLQTLCPQDAQRYPRYR
jgi:23S rRNA pseudouridine2605 synthase